MSKGIRRAYGLLGCALGLAVLACAVSACTVGAGEPGFPVPDDWMDQTPRGTDPAAGDPSTGGATGAVGSDPDEDGTTEGEPPELDLEPVPTATHWDAVPIRGTGPTRGTLLVETQANGTRSTDISATGHFCLDVPLLAEQLNDITLRAVDVEGRWSRMVRVQVRQDGYAPTGGQREPQSTTIPSENVAAGQTIALDGMHYGSGEAWAVTDGNPATYAELLVDGDRFSRPWIYLDVETDARIERVRVRAPAGCPLDEFDLYLGEERTTGGNFLTPIASGETTTTEIDVTIEPQAGRVLSIGLGSFSVLGSGCYDYVWETRLIHGVYALAEIEVWTETIELPAQDQPDEPAAPTCSSGG